MQQRQKPRHITTTTTTRATINEMTIMITAVCCLHPGVLRLIFSKAIDPVAITATAAAIATKIKIKWWRFKLMNSMYQ